MIIELTDKQSARLRSAVREALAACRLELLEAQKDAAFEQLHGSKRRAERFFEDWARHQKRESDWLDLLKALG